MTAPAGPTRSPYRFRLLRYASWREEGYLPLRNATITWKRGDVGRIDASLPLAPGAPPVRPAEQLIVIEQGETPIWGGMIWAVDWSVGQSYAVIRGSEWGGLLKRRRVRRDLRYDQLDQFDIARALIMEAQDGRQFPADLHIDPWQGVGVEAPKSGVLRDRTYLALERKEIWQAVSQLSQVIGGFDFFIRPHYRGDALEFWLEFSYPPGEQSSELVFEYRQGWPGSSVVEYSWPWDGSSVVNRAEAANDEEVQTAEDPSAWDRYPLLEDLTQAGGEHGATRSETLREHAQAYLLQDRLPRVGGTLTLRSDFQVTPALLGQRVRFRATSWRHPAGPNGRPGFDQELVVNGLQLALPSDERPAEMRVEVESEQWTAIEGRSSGARGGGGRMLPGADLMGALREMQTRQDLALGEVRRVTEVVDHIAGETGVAPIPPPEVERPPEPPQQETTVVLHEIFGNQGQHGGSLAIATRQFWVPRAGSLHVEAYISLQPIQWSNNEGMGNGTRRASFTIDYLWTTGRQMVGGSNPNWAVSYPSSWDEWWGITAGGWWTSKFWLDIAGGNQLVVRDGWYRLTFVG